MLSSQLHARRSKNWSWGCIASTLPPIPLFLLPPLYFPMRSSSSSSLASLMWGQQQQHHQQWTMTLLLLLRMIVARWSSPQPGLWPACALSSSLSLFALRDSFTILERYLSPLPLLLLNFDVCFIFWKMPMLWFCMMIAKHRRRWVVVICHFWLVSTLRRLFKWCLFGILVDIHICDFSWIEMDIVVIGWC